MKQGDQASPGTRAERLRALSLQAYWAAETPKEAKMAGILLDLFAPDTLEADRPSPKVRVISL